MFLTASLFYDQVAWYAKPLPTLVDAVTVVRQLLDIADDEISLLMSTGVNHLWKHWLLESLDLLAIT